MSLTAKKGDKCTCVLCKQKHDFELPLDIIDNVISGKVVIFAGAGISTENKLVFPSTFYEDICYELKLDSKKAPAFPELMSRFCTRPNGRALLLNKLHERFSYLKSFPEVYSSAARFHRELSTLYGVDNIITTNWDDLFERECGAVPYVTANDFALWNLPGRKVFKIHGSINNIGSIIMTNEDYKMCYKALSTGVLGSSLKMMLATKTIIYMGYSFSDADILRIHKLLTAEMRGLRPRSYIVTLDKSRDNGIRKAGLTPIYTDATYFLSIVKKHMVSKGHLLSDDVFNGVELLLDKVYYEHMRMTTSIDIIEHPEIIYAASYQDGLIHALQRILAVKNTGYYSHECNVNNAIQTYNEIRKRKLRERIYHDVAYIEGYLNGMLFLVVPKTSRRAIPIYYVFGIKDQPLTYAKYIKANKMAKTTHKAAYYYAKRIIENKYNHGSEATFHHTPFL
jgi:hypothetical protein